MPLTRSQIEAWDTTHLFQAATHWNKAAAIWEDSFDTVHRESRAPGGTVFSGESADALVNRTMQNTYTTDDVTGRLRAAAHIAQGGEHQLEQARRDAVEAIQGADGDDFLVGEDLSVTDRKQPTSEWEILDRLQRAEIHAYNIQSSVLKLQETDAEVAAGIARSTTGIIAVDFRMGGGLDSQQCHDAAAGQQDDITRRLIENTMKGALLGGIGGAMATGGPGAIPGLAGGALAGGLGTAIDIATGDHQLPEECR